MKIKVPTNHLQHGMYIAELDRPWVGTPFLFQGFLLDDDEDLSRLRELCAFVFVDDLQSSADMRVQRAIRDLMGEVASGRVQKLTVEFEEWTGVQRLRQTLEKLGTRQNAAAERLRQLAQIPDGGTREHLVETRDAAIGLVEGVTADPRASFWLTLLAENDSELGAHAINVCVFAVGFASFLGFDDDMRQVVGQGAVFHDIGMSRVPEWLRKKEAPLSRQEHALIRHHARHGAHMLAELKRVDPRILDIVLMHHERMDGGGYPRGLHGDQIPLHVRLVSICNRYESLTREGPGGAGLPPAQALQQLLARADSWYDRNMVEAFIRWIGVYPLGSLVRLRNGYLCLVISTDPVRRLKPTVLLVRDPAQRPVLPRKTVNLEALTHSPLAAEWSIDGIVAPSSAGVDVRELLLDELRILPHAAAIPRNRIPA